MAYQGVFLMGAFCAASKIQPRLQPKDGETAQFRHLQGGVRIEARQVNHLVGPHPKYSHYKTGICAIVILEAKSLA